MNASTTSVGSLFLITNSYGLHNPLPIKEEEPLNLFHHRQKLKLYVTEGKTLPNTNTLLAVPNLLNEIE